MSESKGNEITKENNRQIKDPTIGYVIEIPTSDSIIINLGKKDKVSIGDKFEVFEPGPDVIDFPSNDIIGRYDFPKTIVEAQEIYEQFTLCQRVIKTTKNAFSITMASLLSDSPSYEIKQLNVDVEQVKNWKIEDSIIKIGDPIKQH